MKVESVVVRKSDFVLELRSPEGVERFPVAIGSNPDGADKEAPGDCRTPEGDFEIVSIEESADWERDGERVYGPFFLRIACPPWEGIGIHGTNEPETVGTRATMGCIRMRNEDLVRVASRVGVGTKIVILA
jgi:lipoprotein-anchoring transpeptidase ErfK/SrfK